MRRVPLALVLSAWLVSCGGTGSEPQPRIDFSDLLIPDWVDTATWVDPGLPDPRRGDHVPRDADAGGPDGDAAIGQDADALPDLADLQAADHLETDAATDAVETDLPPTCTVGEKLCDGAKVVQCTAPDGQVEVVETCSDGNGCTTDGCQDGACMFTPVSGCCEPACPFGELCVNGQCVCAAQCFGKQCGDDGCGSQCGTCDPGWECTPQGTCACVPACAGKQCGDDGCGGKCGTCLGQEVCTDGTCLCVPACAGKQCGDDGCGGTCGTCPALHLCQQAACVYSCPYCPAPSGCVSGPHNGHVYYVCQGGESWGGADKACQKAGLHLATLASQGENDFVTALAGGAYAWIGYYEEWWSWHWVNGDPGGYEAWDKDQPDDGDFWTVEDCAALKPNGKWNDDECWDHLWFICEFDAVK